MSSNAILGISLFFLLLTFVVARRQGSKEGRLRKELKKEKKDAEATREPRRKDAEATREARRMENLRKHRFVVYIRRGGKDGKSSFEASLIGTLLKTGATVELLSENNGCAIANGDVSLLKDGLLALVGTAWDEDDYISCEYRLLASDASGKGKILDAGDYYGDDDNDTLADPIVKNLSSTLLETPENK